MSPIGWIRLGDHLGIGNDESRITNGGGGKGHRHAVVVMRIDNRGILTDSDTLALPRNSILALNLQHITQFQQFLAQGLDAVALLEAQGAHTSHAARPFQQT